MNETISDGTALHGPTRELAAFTAHLQYDALPPAVVEKAKACVLDAIGCMVFGATLPWTRIVAEVVREEGGNPQALVIGGRERTSVSQAVLVNSTAGHAFELDDAHTRASMHASPEAPLGVEQLTGKFERLAAHALDSGARARLRAHVNTLEHLTALEPLIACLRV